MTNNPYMTPVPPIPPVYRDTNHTFHFLMCFITLGMWVIVWPVVAAWNMASNSRSKHLYRKALASYSHAVAERDRMMQA